MTSVVLFLIFLTIQSLFTSICLYKLLSKEEGFTLIELILAIFIPFFLLFKLQKENNAN